jgi:hypothetical protein
MYGGQSFLHHLPLFHGWKNFNCDGDLDIIVQHWDMHLG